MTQNNPKVTLVQSINHALNDAMESDKSVLVLGEDVARCGGVFRATENLLDRFGKARVIDTPLAESAIIGTAVGLAALGMKPVAEMQFSGFSYQAFGQIEQHVSRLSNRSCGEFNMSMVIRMPQGGGVRAFEHHSESREAYFLQTPGLKVVYPSNIEDAYGLLRTAIEDPDPVIFLEALRLYRSVKGVLPSKDFRVKLGQANRIQEGRELTLVSYGSTVPLCQEALEQLQEKVAVDFWDLRSLFPWDEKSILESVQKTGRLVIVHEAPLSLGFGAEIAARMAEKAFWCLKAPILRVTAPDLITPYYQREMEYLPNAEKILQAILNCMEC